MDVVDPRAIPALIFGTAAALFALPMIAVWLFAFSATSDQSKRDAAALSAIQLLRRGKRLRRPLATLLRSFTLDELFGPGAAGRAFVESNRVENLLPGAAAALAGGSIRGFVQIGFSPLASLMYKRAQFETKLFRAVKKLRPRFDTCSIGRENQSLGFGRIQSSDADWRELAHALLDNSNVIILLFSPSAGTSWELGQILSSPERLRRTVFIIPPTELVREDSATARYQLEKDYAILAQRFADARMAAPAFRSDMAFFFAASGECVKEDLETTKSGMKYGTSVLKASLLR